MTTWPGNVIPGGIDVTTQRLDLSILDGTVKRTVVVPFETRNQPQGNCGLPFRSSIRM